MRKMTNLLTETIAALFRGGVTTSDVRWVGSADGAMAITWDEFAYIAAATNYETGLAKSIAGDLVVVGDGWWLEQEENESTTDPWRFVCPPRREPHATSFRKVIGWNRRLKDINPLPRK